MCIEFMLGYDRKADVLALFDAYMDMLITNDPAFKTYLGIQNYEDEIAHLDTKYGLPDGRLYLVCCDGEPAGCIALRKIDSHNCELKRLYVKENYRGQGLGKCLVRRIISDAKQIGYSYMLLDTLPFLNTAIQIYKDFGFVEIDKYNDSPMENSIYMRLKL